MTSEAPIVRVRLPAVLRPLAGGRAELRGAGWTVAEVLGALGREHPELRARLLDERGRIRRYVTFFRNGEDVRALGGAEAPVEEGDEIIVVPALSGGLAAREDETATPGSSPRGERLDRALARVAALAERTPRAEACGFVLMGAGGQGPEVVPVTNRASDPAHAFSMDAAEVLVTLRAIERRGARMLAIYHSHPDGRAGLSAADRAALTCEGQPLWPGVELWVVAMEAGAAAEIRAYGWAGERWAEQFRTRGPFTER